MHHVLLVDDSKTVVMSLQAILTKGGFSVATAGDGVEALGVLGAGPKPSLIITDLNMPRMDGISFIREARKTNRFTPILMLTTESQQTKRDEGKKAGATGWLVKPVQPDDLLSVIKRLVPGA
jgi:two-component system chemotaxis response regulator CheY